MRPTVWNATEPGVQDALTAADQRLIDGLIWAAEPWTPGPGSTDGPTVPVPAVGLNVVAAGVDLPRVVAGDAETGQVVARHFADAGRRTVALVGADGTGVARERADGFRRGARRYDLALPPRLAIACERTPEAAARAFGEALDAGELPAAAFCVDDLVGIGVLEVLRERGLRAPDHLWVMGHDGIEAGEWRSFGLTTAAVRVRRMVDAALELLLERLAGGEARRTTVTVAPEVVVRRSTAFAPFAGLPSTGLRDGE
jgi:LacI family transcriptional regulator